MRPAVENKPMNIPLRVRIYEVASDLFYRYGIRAVGVESIAAAANTTKAGLYRNYASKDALVAEWLRQRDAEHRTWWLSVCASHRADPVRQLKEIFSTIGQLLALRNRGCPLTNSSVELTANDQEARAVAIEHKAWLRAQLGQLCAQAVSMDAERLADTLFLLMEGAKVSNNALGSGGPGTQLGVVAAWIIDAHIDAARDSGR